MSAYVAMSDKCKTKACQKENIIGNASTEKADKTKSFKIHLNLS